MPDVEGTQQEVGFDMPYWTVMAKTCISLLFGKVTAATVLPDCKPTAVS